VDHSAERGAAHSLALEIRDALDAGVGRDDDTDEGVVLGVVGVAEDLNHVESGVGGANQVGRCTE